MALKCTVRQRADVSILDLDGVLSLRDPEAAGSVALGDKVRELVESGQKKILLNLAGVTYIDSAGVGELIGTFTSVRNRGAGLKLVNPTREVKKLLELTKLNQVMDVRDDEEKAVEAFSKTIAPAA